MVMVVKSEDDCALVWELETTAIRRTRNQTLARESRV